MKTAKTAIASAALALAAPALPQSPVSPSAMRIDVVEVIGGLRRPTFMTMAPGDDSRMFVLESRHGIRVLRDGVLLGRFFLDLQGILAFDGLASLAFHPDYQSNGRFYVVYLDTELKSHLVEYTVSSDPDIADPSSAVHVLGPFQQPSPVHNWNHVEFGPDGMLYVAVGEGISTADTTINNGQDLTTTLGKILRLDVDLPPPYVPPDNPFVGVPGVREEIWAYGLRQPWRFHFDALTGDLWIGEVGSTVREEISVIRGTSPGGDNLGWRCYEGAHCWDHATCAGCDDSAFVDALFDYEHAEGRCCIIGGYVYRGAAIPWLRGAYFFSDHCTGEVWSLRSDGTHIWDFRDWTARLGSGASGLAIEQINSFAVDHDGELYMLDNVGGELFKIVPALSLTESYCVTSPSSAGPGAVMGSTGSTRVSAADFRLTVRGGVPAQFGVFFYGDAQVQVPFGNGFRCVGGAQVFRLLPVATLDALGNADHLVDFDSPGVSAQITPGTTWNFQFWYRDPLGGGSFFNLSDGLQATFSP